MGAADDPELIAGAQLPIDEDAAHELIDAARDLTAEAGAARPLPAGVIVRAGRDGGERFEPVGAADAEPPILWLHGGGYVIGSVTSHATLAARIADAARRPVVLPDYRQGPEDPFPAGLDDAEACFHALGRPLLAGDSAGGGLALALAIRLREAGAPLPPAIALIAPWADLSLHACWRDPERATPRDADLDRTQLAVSAQAYAGDTALDDPCVSPVHADLAGLPPLLIQVGADELLAPDVRRLADRAREAGVPVTVRESAGAGHVWHMDETPEADAAIAELAGWLVAQLPGTATPDS